MSSERKWKDSKDKDMKSGKWTPKEIKHLRRLLCKYASRKNLTAEQLASICSDTTPSEFDGVWTQIAKFFPDRSVQSVHNACKRHFNPYNYKGPWSVEEERKLIELVSVHNTKWKEIGEILQRTANNVKDKWKQMGGKNNELRKTGTWSSEETKELVFLVFKYLEIPVSEVESVKVEHEDLCLNELVKIIVKYIDNIRKVEIGWQTISQKFMTRSSVDCRTRWNFIMNNRVPENMVFSNEDDLEIFKAIRAQNVLNIEDIDFGKIQNMKSEGDNRSRFKILAKAMSGRLKLSLNQILDKLEHSYNQKKQEDDSLLDYYVNKYKKN